ncbi:hypothetical protein ACP275_08G146900 [Erythranthe tilingii]
MAAVKWSSNITLMALISLAILCSARPVRSSEEPDPDLVSEITKPSSMAWNGHFDGQIGGGMEGGWGGGGVPAAPPGHGGGFGAGGYGYGGVSWGVGGEHVPPQPAFDVPGWIPVPRTPPNYEQASGRSSDEKQV